ncbi:type I polyketide synthase [Nocardioides yefusunii]|uniref:Type I polyketide synthase n=1 Tax=Nocardioides yefusunii TaxID=2500546 RepID=A0ABW1R348_9ACTN|nr:type I polyketide synthase [Nocardioides yefusunii]
MPHVTTAGAAAHHSAAHHSAAHHSAAHHRTETPELVVAADPVGRTNAALVTAAQRAGGTGLVDAPDLTALQDVLADLARRRSTGGWMRPGAGLLSRGVGHDDALDTALDDAFSAVVLDATLLDDLGAPWEDTAALWRTPRRRVLAQVTSRDAAVAAVEGGADGLVVVGCEAGGRVGTTQSFVLLQQTVDLGVPVWVRGGTGLHTTAAVVAGGGAGVVVDTQLGLLREAALPATTAAALRLMDGSETRVVGGHRLYTRPDLEVAALDDAVTSAEVAARLGADLHSDLVPLGQDCGVASDWATRFVTVGGVVQALRESVTTHLDALRAGDPLAPGSALAATHGTQYPIAQGPMTRVSDRAEFAAAVAEGGGLPFLALALLPAAEVRSLLAETAALLGDRPWGVGLLGFAPADLLAAQLEVVTEVSPPFALIAGGRPSQAAALEADGIASYLHVPSPGLLDAFLADGARSFVFEGRECGGHVGPRSSFALWEAQVERLLQVNDPQNLRILLAGGIHDARSAAMAAAAVAPLAARGAQVGVLMGTAYLFTTEAVASGAIQETFQEVAVDCERTMLVETAPGHATRCVETEFARAFAERKAELESAGVDAKSRWAELEQLNLGRLRIASKGLVRTDGTLQSVDVDRQIAEGMYMIGEVATLRDEVTDIAALHASVSVGSVSWVHEHLGLDVETDDEVATEADPFDIAIIGMETFLPGAVGTEQFWANVVAGTDHVTEVPAERWDTDLYFDAETYDKRQGGRTTPSKWGGFVDAIGFDPLSHGIPPASLAAIEPVQLLALEVASRALADAGYAQRSFDRERASVVFGAESGNELGGAYGIRAFLPQLFGQVPDELENWLPSLTEDSFPGVLANVIAGRIANRLDLGGVNYTVDAACGSSLAALDAACKELRQGSSDLVIAGGADLHNGLNDYLMFASVHALSPTGRCRTFDADADGIALGEGIAAVVLKRRVDAERDGDRIYAVIDAVAGSSDGRHLGLTAPRKEGQQRAVARALEASGVSLTEVGLVEAHGTGTVVGDRTEMATLTELFAEADVEPGSVVLGSVKSQIGHTKCTAGLAGLVKVAKALHHAVLPPTINLDDPNPYYDAQASPFRFHDTARPWAAATRRAGVSAFGFGGTNFHAVVSAYEGGDRPAHKVAQWPAELFVVRAVDEATAANRLDDLRALVDGVLASDPGAQRHRLRDLARTVSTSGRGAVRAAFVAGSFLELRQELDRLLDEAGSYGLPAAPDAAERGKVAFLYPGQGSQRPGMLNDLFVTFSALDDVAALAEPWAAELFPPAGFTAAQRAAQRAAITATEVAQPTLGVAALAMTRMLRSVGVQPDVAGGHSYGELAALAAAGVMDDATLLRLSAVRGQAVLDAVEASGGDPGTMAAVSLTIEELLPRLTAFDGVVVANHNAPRQVVVSGPTASVHAAVEAWEADGVRATLIPVACAFHSPLVARASESLAAELAALDLSAPQFPVWSNVTAEPYPGVGSSTGDDAVEVLKGLLSSQVSDGVRFVDQIESMYAAGVRVFVEAGPGRVLGGQVAKILGDRPHTVVATDVNGENGVRRFLQAVADLAMAGVEVDTRSLFLERAEDVDLRTWPLKAPGWTVSGAFVRRADGTVLPNSHQPADTMPALSPVATPEVFTMSSAPVETSFDDVSASPVLAGTGADVVLTEYLRSMRQVVAAERDVVLRYLGATPAPAPSGAVTAAAPSSAVTAAPASVTAASAVAPAARQAAAPAPASLVPAQRAPEPVAAAPAATVDLLLAVQEVVSERTGYPVDMLEPDLDLEADLSIDSIKRIEIVGELAQKIGLGSGGPGAGGAELDENVVEELSRHKTLAAIVTWIEGMQGVSSAPGTSAPAAATDGAAPAAATPTATATATSLSGDALLLAVQEVVSERTGYPVDMLEPDLDLEADLSIDSIKRIEIVGELAQKIGLGSGGPGAGGAELDENVVEELSRHKTLAAIVTWIEGLSTPAAVASSVSASATTSVGDAVVVPAQPTPSAAAPEQVMDLSTGLYEVVVEPLGPVVSLGRISGSSVALVEGHSDLTPVVASALTERGARVVRVPFEEVSAHTALLAEVDVVVDLSTTSGDPRIDARDVFAALRPALLGRAQRLLGVGVAAHAADDAVGAAVPTGLPGLFRSLAREREDLLVRAVEVTTGDLAGDLHALAVCLVDELLDLDAPAAVSWTGGVRTARVAGPAIDLEQRVSSLGLDAESVVVLTGGARGITARIAEGIARTTPCRLVLVGRSPAPSGAEDPRLRGTDDALALRRRILENASSDGVKLTPAEVEKQVSAVIADREVTATLALLRELGSDAEYVSMDVRSPGFGALLDALHGTFGRLDGVIHGAGVLDDRLVRDKTAEGFDRVFGTKVEGARAILDRQHLGMRFVVLFGSVSGVFGNKGQVDYAAANDALDTLAQIHDGRHGCHVVSLDWGPWAGGGMVSPELEREYARRGVGLLDSDDGVTALLNEVAGGRGRPSQIVVMAGEPAAFAPSVAGRGRRAADTVGQP